MMGQDNSSISNGRSGGGAQWRGRGKKEAMEKSKNSWETRNPEKRFLGVLKYYILQEGGKELKYYPLAKKIRTAT